MWRAASIEACRVEEEGLEGWVVLFLRLDAAEAWREGMREARTLPSTLARALEKPHQSQ